MRSNQNPPSYLEFAVRLSSGATEYFRQDDAKAVAAMLELVYSGRLFARRHLAVSSAASLTAFPTGAIESIELDGDVPLTPPAGLPYELGEIDAERFAQGHHPRAEPGLSDARPTLFWKLDLRSEQVRYAEMRPMQLPPDRPRPTGVDIDLMIERLFQGDSIYLLRESGGLTLLHPAHLMGVVITPPPPEAPPSAWCAEYVTRP